MEWSNKIGVFTKTQGTKQQAIQKTPLVFMIYLPLIKSGPGENRTPVQTRKPYAFYMLSRLLVFDDGPESDTQAIAYPLKFSPFAKGGLRLTLN